MGSVAEVKEYVVPLRWRDLDNQGHVYHGTFLTLLDEARTAFFRERGIESPASYVLARIELDYVTELTFDPPEVSVSFEVQRVGNSSLHLTERMCSGGVLRAKSHAVIVLWDKDGRRSRELTAAERTGIAELAGGNGGAA